MGRGPQEAPVPRRRALWTEIAILIGRQVSRLSRRLGLGAGAVVGGRLTLALDPLALSRLAVGRQVVLVSGTNGKTTTAHMAAAALRSLGPVAHNATGANMLDGVVAALIESRSASYAVLEVDELHMGLVADAVHPAAVVLLNLTRDQLDRGSEVGAVAGSLSAALSRHPGTVVVANADDPRVVGVVDGAPRVVWVAAGAAWLADAVGSRGSLARPTVTWSVAEGGVQGPEGTTPLHLSLPGSFNLGNAALAMAAVDVIGVPPARAAEAMSRLNSIGGRYAVVHRGNQELHLLLAKNPAGWAASLPLLARASSLLLVVNAHEADGRDTSWLWDVPFEELPVRPTVASGERAGDIGLRLSYAEREHTTESDPIAALDLLPAGQVYVVANYTAFNRLVRRLTAEEVAR